MNNFNYGVKIQEEKLTDGSIVYNVNIFEDGFIRIISLAALNKDHAEEIKKNLLSCLNTEDIEI